MRAVKCSPLVRIALLSLAVLLAHTAHAANPHSIRPAAPPCARKVAAAQPDPDKTVAPTVKRIVRPRHSIHSRSSVRLQHAAIFHSVHSSAPVALTRRTVYIPPQRLPFTLRI